MSFSLGLPLYCTLVSTDTTLNESLPSRLRIELLDDNKWVLHQFALLALQWLHSCVYSLKVQIGYACQAASCRCHILNVRMAVQ